MPGFLTSKVLAYVSGGLLLIILGLSFNTWRLGNKVDNLNQAIGRYEIALETSNASINTLQARVEQCAEEAFARDERARQAAEDARQARIRHEAEREALQGRVESLRGLIRERDGACEADSELLEALEGM